MEDVEPHPKHPAYAIMRCFRCLALSCVIQKTETFQEATHGMASALAAILQVYGMGNKQELLVTVRQPEGVEGTIEVSMITDVAADVVLHWGVKKGQSGEWLLPAKDLWPQGSQVKSPAILQLEAASSVLSRTLDCHL